MAGKGRSRLSTEMLYIFLSPLLVLIGVLGYGILFDRWHKDPLLILHFSGYVYAAILLIRFINWMIKALSR